MNKPDPEKWVNEYSNLLLKFAYFRVNNEELAKDLVQDTYFSALKNLDTFKGEASEKNWLFLILKNKIIDYYRKKNLANFKTPETDDKFFSDTFDDAGHWWNETKPEDWDAGYDVNIDSAEFMRVFEQCKSKLSEIHNAVFCFRYLDGEKCEEVCMKLGISSSNYWMILHRAKLQLRRCLEKKWFNL